MESTVTKQELLSHGKAAAQAVSPFLSNRQLTAMLALIDPQSEEFAFFLGKLLDLAKLIEGMPKTYEQEGMGDLAVVHLHYFIAGSDWYITEKDVDGGVAQAFGYAILNGDRQCAELGYISIQELTAHGAELDLYFSPCTLAEIKLGARWPLPSAAVGGKPWVLVGNAGQSDETVVESFSTFVEAIAAKSALAGSDVMKRLGDGTLTTEF